MAIVKMRGIFLVLLNFLAIVVISKSIKLGKHSTPSKGLDLIGKFSTPGVFYEHFVKPGVPLLMKSVLEEPVVQFPAFTNWKDDYLRDTFGNEEFSVEGQKKENRMKTSEKMTLNEFIDNYKSKSVYLIDSASKSMIDDLALPKTLQCGGFEKSVHDVIVWFSSGSTSSVLHRDPLNNLLCLLDGSKDFFFIDKKYKSDVELVGFEENGSYSTIDVDNVNSKKFSTLLSLPWIRAHADEGDCIFIPYGWYHQIRSNGKRNMAVNFWFTHRWWFNHPDCHLSDQFNYTEPLNQYQLASSNELVRFQMLKPYKDLEVITKTQFLLPDNINKDKRLELFSFINLDRDANLTWEELYNFDIDEAVKNFSDVFALDFVLIVDSESVDDNSNSIPVKDEDSDNDPELHIPVEEYTSRVKSAKDEL